MTVGPSPKSISILVVDDDPSVTLSLTMLLKKAGWRVLVAHHPTDGLRICEENQPDLVISDMNFSPATDGEEGLNFLFQLRTRHPQLPVILLTAWGSIGLAVAGMKAGAFDFVTKPWDNNNLLRTLRTALSLTGSRDDDQLNRQALDQQYDFSGLIGEDPSFLRVLQTMARVAATDASVLILGESGTGKELVAEALHRNSARQAGPYIKVNLGGIASTLFESEMFGHTRGAFTDAKSQRKGRFMLAHGGTIFLDEIGDLDHSGQVKMLRVLQDRRFEILGSSQTVSVDVRVVSATNRDLSELVAEGVFREDLYYRLNLITLQLPPLRQRRGDISLLANHFFQQAARTYARPVGIIKPDAMQWLEHCPWPGNIRQLKQTMERAVLMASHQDLGREDFLASDLSPTTNQAVQPLPPVGHMTLEELEKAMILKSIDHFGANLTKVAEALGLSRAALYRRLEKYRIQH